MHMYARCGGLVSARTIFDEMRASHEISSATWNVIIAGYGTDGQAEKALELLSYMKKEGSPNEITITNVLNSLSHAGLVDEALRLLSSMKVEYGISPSVAHYGAVID